jgi:hypothetical protein
MRIMATKTPSPKGTGKFLGRPSKFDPSICAKIIELGRQGKSRAQMVAALGIPYSTFQGWEAHVPEFQAAMEEARTLALAYWEDLGHDHLKEVPGGVKLNTGLWSRSMAARFPREYRDNAKVEIVGKDGGPIEVDHVHDFSTALLDDLLGMRQSNAESSDN